jgi:hypothetical protein
MNSVASSTKREIQSFARHAAQDHRGRGRPNRTLAEAAAKCDFDVDEIVNELNQALQ